MTKILLTGAGFSRNWNGWLADEVFEYLLGCPEVDGSMRTRLFASRANGGGFEDALADLQTELARRGGTEIRQLVERFQAALDRMFDDMGRAFDDTRSWSRPSKWCSSAVAKPPARAPSIAP
jgi:hypothetical protein